jgi:hypothetical protein
MDRHVKECTRMRTLLAVADLRCCNTMRCARTGWVKNPDWVMSSVASRRRQTRALHAEAHRGTSSQHWRYACGCVLGAECGWWFAYLSILDVVAVDAKVSLRRLDRCSVGL